MDKSVAFSYYRKAAEQGDADSQFMIGEMYQNGEGVEKDLKSAAEWLMKAASQAMKTRAAIWRK